MKKSKEDTIQIERIILKDRVLDREMIKKLFEKQGEQNE